MLHLDSRLCSLPAGLPFGARRVPLCLPPLRLLVKHCASAVMLQRLAAMSGIDKGVDLDAFEKLVVHEEGKAAGYQAAQVTCCPFWMPGPSCRPLALHAPV